MARFYVLFKYCYFLWAFISLCCVPVCQSRKYPGKMRGKDRKTGSKGMRLIKVSANCFKNLSSPIYERTEGKGCGGWRGEKRWGRVVR